MHQSILTYGEFVTYIRENVEAVLNEDREAEVVLTEVEKNNGVGDYDDPAGERELCTGFLHERYL